MARPGMCGAKVERGRKDVLVGGDGGMERKRNLRRTPGDIIFLRDGCVWRGVSGRFQAGEEVATAQGNSSFLRYFR